MKNDELSSSFYSLTPDKILAAVEMLGERCTGRLLQLNSLENRVYEVEIECSQPNKTKADSFRVVKFYRPARWSKAQIEEEHSFLKELDSEGISVVSPLPFADGSTIATLPEEQISFSVYSKVQGRLSDELKKEELQTLGRYLARIHLVGSKQTFSVRPNLDSTRLGSESLNYILKKGYIPTSLEERYSQITSSIIEKSAVFVDSLPALRLHGDFHVGNVLWNGAQCFILDFDDCVNGPAVQDFWLINPGRDTYSQDNQEIFLKAYQELRNFDETELKAVEALRSLRMIFFSAWIARRWEDPFFQRSFPDFLKEQYWQEQITTLYEQGELL